MGEEDRNVRAPAGSGELDRGQRTEEMSHAKVEGRRLRTGFTTDGGWRGWDS